MNEDEYSSLINLLWQAFNLLYNKDVEDLPPELRINHRKALSAAYLAIIRAENKQFSDILALATDIQDDLKAKTSALSSQLYALQAVTTALNVFDGILKVCTAIAKLLK